MIKISGNYKNPEFLKFASLFFVFMIIPFFVLNFSNATLVELKLEEDDPSYIRKAKEEDAFPSAYREIRDAAGFEISEIEDLGDGRNFIESSDGSYFTVGGDDVWLFEFDTAAMAEQVSKGFYSRGYKYVDPITKKTTTLLFTLDPQFFLKDKFLLIYTGANAEISDMLTEIIGGKFEPRD
jgi:hypothetical protein